MWVGAIQCQVFRLNSPFISFNSVGTGYFSLKKLNRTRIYIGRIEAHVGYCGRVLCSASLF